MAKIDRDIAEIKISVGKIEEHLRNQDEVIKEHTNSIKCMQAMNYKLAGAIAVLVFLIDFGVRYLLKV